MVLWWAAVLLAVCSTAWADDPVSTRSDRPLQDAYGDPLPPDAVLRLGTTRFHHRSWIRDAAIAPDGRMLASAAVNQDVGIALWEIPSGSLLDRLLPSGDRQRRIPDAAPRIAGAALVPDLKTLVTSKGRELLFWDVQSGEMTAAMPSESADEGGSIAFSPDGRLLLMVDRAFTGSDALRVFDVESRRVIANFDSGQGRPRCFAFSPDGTRLVTGMDDGTALVGDLATSRPGSH